MPDSEANQTSNSPSSGNSTTQPSISSKWWVPAAGLGIPAIILFSKLGAGGIWDPHELNVADFARRIAVNVLGAKSLALTNGDNSMPTLGDLGRGELPFSSIAVGFSAFGLHEWAGRLPLALWAMAAVVALYWFFKRLIDARAGMYATVVLATMPLFFVQARTMLGDIVTMSALTIAFSGLGVSVFDRGSSVRSRLAALGVGLVGLAAGFLSRGALIGLGIPLLSVGFAWALFPANRLRPSSSDPIRSAVGSLALLSGIVVGALGAKALFSADSSRLSPWVGALIAPPSKLPTFDNVILYLGHGLFPWSAFIPLSAGRLFRSPSETDDTLRERMLGARALLLVGSALCFGVFAMMAPRVGHIPFAGIALLAGIAAVAIRDYEKEAPSSRALAVVVVVFLLLFYRDFDQWPEKGLSAYGVSATFPDTFKLSAIHLILAAAIICAVLIFASWLERDDPSKKVFDVAEYRALLNTIRTTNSGNLMFVLVVVEAALVGFAVLVWVGVKAHWKQVIVMSANLRVGAINAWWAVPTITVLVIFACYTFRDVCRVLFPRLRLSRASATAIGGVLAGCLFSFSYYPKLASQLSPKDVFDSYDRLHRNGEQLALLGVNSRTATYYSGSDVQTLSDVEAAHRWLSEGTARRWVALRSEDLPKLNSIYRSRVKPPVNLPVLDGHSGQIMLASNKLIAGETSENPLNTIVLSEKPTPEHAVDADLQSELLALGWEVVDLSGKRVPFVVAGKKYRMKLYYQVTGKITSEWETFIHIDGHQRRFNGDHKPMESRYPMNLWQVGDYLVDDYEFALEPNFTPGKYMVYYGFFIGDSRLKVSRGKHHEDRIEGGELLVQ